MMNQYETVFILTPVLSEPQMKEAVDKFKRVIEKQGAEIVHEESWGLRKLAYEIQHKTTGFYYLIEFRAEGPVIDKLEVEYRRDERVLRFLTTKMDKHAIEFTEKRRKKQQEKKANQEGNEAQQDNKADDSSEKSESKENQENSKNN